MDYDWAKRNDGTKINQGDIWTTLFLFFIVLDYYWAGTEQLNFIAVKIVPHFSRTREGFVFFMNIILFVVWTSHYKFCLHNENVFNLILIIIIRQLKQFLLFDGCLKLSESDIRILVLCSKYLIYNEHVNKIPLVLTPKSQIRSRYCTSRLSRLSERTAIGKTMGSSLECNKRSVKENVKAWVQFRTSSIITRWGEMEKTRHSVPSWVKIKSAKLIGIKV